MSAILLRSRLVSSLLRNRNRRLFSSDLATNRSNYQSELSSHLSKDQPLKAAQTVVADQPPPPPPPPPPTSQGSNRSRSKAWSFLKYALFGAVTGAAAFTCYVSYAYTLDEIEEKSKALRAAAPLNYKIPDDAPALEKFKRLAYHTALSVPAKATEVYLDTRRMLEEQIKGYTEPYADKLLPDLHPLERHVFTLVLDLQETLLYSHWTREKGWQTIKRPGVDAFLEHLAQYFEIIVYSDYPNVYIDPVLDRLDVKHLIRFRLGKAATKYQNGQHYRDLSKLNRDPAKVIYLSAHARENTLQPENGALIKPFKLELDDTALLDFIPFLEFVARNPPADIRQVLAAYEGHDIPEEFIRRSKDHQRRMQEQRQPGLFRRR
ncbi:mitochondrial import inner membrane translocase subunit TIM50 [Ziziphus jujuba]|uniref:Mitochondrial import inner membrane translocase subunit TIM50 n=1 Tax=Ziziphus jujuba TaxID=326968 RepID=A0ABM3I8S0_ZIZJJ|nr:mitochondrial import inner membrane translocase subunit TIM50 [Ziziphus jujuba]